MRLILTLKLGKKQSKWLWQLHVRGKCKKSVQKWIIRGAFNCEVYHVLLGKQVENYETRGHVASREDKLEIYAEIFSGILNGRNHLEDLYTDRRTNLHYIKWNMVWLCGIYSSGLRWNSLKGFFSGGNELSSSSISSTEHYTVLPIIRAQSTISFTHKFSLIIQLVILFCTNPPHLQPNDLIHSLCNWSWALLLHNYELSMH